jgi:hypothetical protein
MSSLLASFAAISQIALIGRVLIEHEGSAFALIRDGRGIIS